MAITACVAVPAEPALSIDDVRALLAVPAGRSFCLDAAGRCRGIGLRAGRLHVLCWLKGRRISREIHEHTYTLEVRRWIRGNP